MQELFFLSVSFWAERRGQPRAVQIVRGISRDRPMCRGPGVWLAFWLQLFSQEGLSGAFESGSHTGSSEEGGVDTCFLLWRITVGYSFSCVFYSSRGNKECFTALEQMAVINRKAVDWVFIDTTSDLTITSVLFAHFPRCTVYWNK